MRGDISPFTSSVWSRVAAGTLMGQNTTDQCLISIVLVVNQKRPSVWDMRELRWASLLVISHPAQFRRTSPGGHLRVISAPLLALQPHRPARARSHTHDHTSLYYKHPVHFRTGERSQTRSVGLQQRHHDQHPGASARNQLASVSVQRSGSVGSVRLHPWWVRVLFR